jgi:mitochondrial fusion and transport protein UGO1
LLLLHLRNQALSPAQEHRTAIMNQPREGPNPLRPYYIPPSIGLPVEPPVNATSAGISGHGATSKISFGSSARDMFSDIDYSDYLSDSSPSVSEMIKNVLDQAVWKYTNVLLAQPFEVAKTILQVYVVQDVQEQYPQERRGREGYREDRWTEVRALSLDFLHLLTYCSPNPILRMMSHPTLPPMRP